MSLRALLARAAVWKPLSATPPSWLGVVLVLAAFALAHGPRVVHNLPKWHWEDGRHFHHNRQQIHSIAAVSGVFRRPSQWAPSGSRCGAKRPRWSGPRS